MEYHLLTQNEISTWFRVGLLPKDLLTGLNNLQDNWNQYMTFISGIELTDTVILEDNLIIKFKGTYSGSYFFMDKEINLEGTDPVVIYNGSEFITSKPTISLDNYPIGTVLPFVINVPNNWRKLEQEAYIELGDTNLSILPPSQINHKHTGKLTGNMNILTSDLGWIDYIANYDGNDRPGWRAIDRGNMPLAHKHNGSITEDDPKSQSEPNPPNIKLVFAEKIKE